MSATAKEALRRIHASVRAQGGQVILDREVLGEDRQPEQWMALLGRPSLRLDGAEVSVPDADGAFRITGTADLPRLGATPAEVDVFAVAVPSLPGADDPPAVHVVLRTGPAAGSWRPPGGGTPPDHLDVETGRTAASPLTDLALPALALVLSSLDAADAVLPSAAMADRLGIGTAPIRQGLTLFSTIDTTGSAWRTARAIAEVEDAAAVTAHVQADQNGSWIELRVDVDTTWSLSPTLGIALDAVVLHSGLDAGGQSASFTAEGHLVIGEPLPVEVTVNIGDPSVRVTAGDHHHPVTLTSLLEALGMDPGVVEDLPEAISEVGLGWLALTVDLDPLRIDSISLAVVSEAPIVLLEDLLTVQPTLVFEATDPFGAGEVALTIVGLWDVGGTVLDLVAHPLTGTFAASLHPGERLTLDALLEHLVPGGPALHVGIDDVEVTGSLITGGFSLRLVAADAFHLALGPAALDVHDVRIVAERDHRTAPFSWDLSGNLSIAGVHLLLHAERADDDDWRVEARGRVDEPLDLAALLRHVMQLGGDDAAVWHPGIPKDYAALAVRKIVLHHVTATATTQLYADIDMDVQLIHGITFDHLTTSVELHDGTLAEASVTAGLQIGGVDLLLESRVDPTHGLELHGETGTGQAIPIGEALASLAVIAGIDAEVPEVLTGLVAEEVHLTYRTRTKDLLLRSTGLLPGTNGVRIDLIAELVHATVDAVSSYTRHLHATLDLGELQLDADLSTSATAGAASRSTIVAIATGDPVHDLPLRPLVARLDPDLAAQVPDAVTLDVRELLLIHQRAAATSRTLVALAVEVGLDLSGLPLVGGSLGSEVRVAIEPVVVSAALAPADMAGLAPLLTGRPITLPLEGIGAGVHLETTLRAGGATWRLGLPIAMDDAGTVAVGPVPASRPAAPTAQTGPIKWFAIGRSFGPVHLNRVGVGFADGVLSAAVDGTLALGPLTLELLGLTASTPLDRAAPTFALRGLGVDYRSGDLELGGAFLHAQVLRDGVVEDEYGGQIVLRTPDFSLSAIGAYSRHDGHPSMFVYAVLTAPLGGPTFFFVTGLALGFGYNRRLVMPHIDDVADFPLVREAMGSAAPAPSLGDELARLGSAIPPQTGAMFLTAGVRFSSFELIDSFVLLAVQIGRRLEIDLLGLSRAVVPPPEAGAAIDPLARLELAIAARFVPDDGILELKGQLTKASYVLSRDCRLEGGFAFSAWLGRQHAGDFVVTLGGYHPHYVPPDHYPTVPRLRFTWQVDPHLLVHGGVYFALTPSTLMAGAHLDATWHSGRMRAWFSAGIDLLVAWKPPHYEALLSVTMGGSYTYEFFGTHHLTVSVSADLEIWGPPFAGRASIDLGIIWITVRFGPQASGGPVPLSWPDFTSSFLPAADEVCSIVVADGLRRELDQPGPPTAVVDSTHLRIRVGSRVPMTGHGTAAFGVGPMALPEGQVSSVLTITVTDEDGVEVDDLFHQTPVTGDVPAALWGSALTPSLHDQRLVRGTTMGVDLTPRRTQLPTQTAALDPALLAYDTTVEHIDPDDLGAPPAPLRAILDGPRLERHFADGASARRRRRLLGSLQVGTSGSAGGGSPARGLVEQLQAPPRVWVAHSPDDLLSGETR